MKKNITKKNNITFYEQYKADNFANQRVLTDGFIDNLCSKLLEFAATTDGSKGFTRFLYSLGISYNSFKNWLVHYPQLNEVYQQAKLLAGETLQENALKRNYDAGFSKLMLYNLDPQYLETQKTLLALKVQDTNAKSIVVVLESYEDTAYQKAKEADPSLTAEQWKKNNDASKSESQKVK